MPLQTAPSQHKTKTTKNQNHAWMPQVVFLCPVVLHKHHHKKEVTLPVFKAADSAGKILGKY